MTCHPIPKPAPRKRKKRTGFSSPPKPYCEACGRTDLPIERHHVIFRSRGGKDVEENRMDLCILCHKEAHGERVSR
jgi:5-methylcytosine-specific restriction endonuclease McrA